MTLRLLGNCARKPHSPMHELEREIGMRSGTTCITSLAMLVAAWLAPGSAPAQDVAAFYRAHPLTLIVGLPPGAAYDVYGRAVARHWAKHIPGNPTLVVQNMPGAGSLTSINHLANTAPKDGTVLATFVR